MRNEPSFPATNRTSLSCPPERPCSKRALVACSNAGGTGPAGTTGPSGMTSTEWGRFGSSFLKCSTTFHPRGTESTRPPRLNPLKFMPPLLSVRPATSLNSTVLVAATARSQLGSTLPAFAVCAAAPSPQRRSVPASSSRDPTHTVTSFGRRIWTVSPSLKTTLAASTAATSGCTACCYRSPGAQAGGGGDPGGARGRGGRRGGRGSGGGGRVFKSGPRGEGGVVFGGVPR